MDSSTLFLDKKFLYVKGMVSKDLCYYFTHMLMVCADRKVGNKGDSQVPGALVSVDHEYAFETLQEIIWPYIEVAVGEELLPTYSYARLYTNKNELIEHRDRPACEVSVTIQLGRSHHYSWPIYMGGHRIDLAEGDGVIYSGCEIKHWRNVCDGPDNYYSGQVFLHYVRKNGPYASEAGDSKTRKTDTLVFVKNRNLAMVEK
jgi:hypothetical protein